MKRGTLLPFTHKVQSFAIHFQALILGDNMLHKHLHSSHTLPFLTARGKFTLTTMVMGNIMTLFSPDGSSKGCISPQCEDGVNGILAQLYSHQPLGEVNPVTS